MHMYKLTLTGLGRTLPVVDVTAFRLRVSPVTFTDFGPVLRLSVAVFLKTTARERRATKDAMFPVCALQRNA